MARVHAPMRNKFGPFRDVGSHCRVSRREVQTQQGGLTTVLGLHLGWKWGRAPRVMQGGERGVCDAGRGKGVGIVITLTLPGCPSSMKRAIIQSGLYAGSRRLPLPGSGACCSRRSRARRSSESSSALHFVEKEKGKCVLKGEGEWWWGAPAAEAVILNEIAAVEVVQRVAGAAVAQEKHAVDAEVVKFLACHEVRLAHHAAQPKLLLLPLRDQKRTAQGLQ